MCATIGCARFVRDGISFADDVQPAMPVGVGRRRVIDTQQIGLSADSANAQPAAAGFDPVGHFALEGCVEFDFADGQQNPEAAQRVFKRSQLDAPMRHARVRENLVDVSRIVHRAPCSALLGQNTHAKWNQAFLRRSRQANDTPTGLGGENSIANAAIFGLTRPPRVSDTRFGEKAEET